MKGVEETGRLSVREEKAQRDKRTGERWDSRSEGNGVGEVIGKAYRKVCDT